MLRFRQPETLEAHRNTLTNKANNNDVRPMAKPRSPVLMKVEKKLGEPLIEGASEVVKSREIFLRFFFSLREMLLPRQLFSRGFIKIIRLDLLKFLSCIIWLLFRILQP